MKRMNQIGDCGWENVIAAPDVVAARLFEADDRGYWLAFRIGFAPPEQIWLDIAIRESCDPRLNVKAA